MSSEASAIQHDAPRVLVIDDSRLVRRAVVSVLRRHGYDVRDVSSVAEFYLQLRLFSPAIVVADVLMPGLGGDEVCRTVKACYAVPVLFYTSLSSEEVTERAQRAGADAVVRKSDDMTPLLDAISGLVNA